MCAVHAVGRVFFPLDQELELLDGEYTPQVYGWLAYMSGWMPFAAAAKLAGALFGVAVSAATVRRMGEAAGAAYVALQSEQTAKLEQCAPPAPAGAARMVVSADGAMVPLVGGEWGEVRTLAIGTVGKRCPAKRRRRRNLSSQPADQCSLSAAVGPDGTPDGNIEPNVTPPSAPAAERAAKARAKQSAGPAGKQAQAADAHTMNISYFSRLHQRRDVHASGPGRNPSAGAGKRRGGGGGHGRRRLAAAVY